jgi:hypothetical protein
MDARMVKTIQKLASLLHGMDLEDWFAVRVGAS